MASSLEVEDVLDLIRDQALFGSKSRVLAHGSAPTQAFNLEAVKAAVGDCNVLQQSIGALNPRNPGLHNDAIQAFKKLESRLLSWYTRSINVFGGGVTAALYQIGTALEQTAAALEQTAAALETLESRVQQLERRPTMQQLAAALEQTAAALETLQSRVQQLEKKPSLRESLQIADSHLGPRAHAGLWFNEAIAVAYSESGEATWSHTSERITERAWVLRHLPENHAGLRVLDVGCTESTLALELASNGYNVTGIDVRPTPLYHPKLRFVQADICNSSLPSESFDIVIALSTLEHIGLGGYGDPCGKSLDRVAMDEIFRVMKSGGRLLLTVPFGHRAILQIHRIYDANALKELTKNFVAETIEYGVRVDLKTWMSPIPEVEAATRVHDPDTGSPGAIAMLLCFKGTPVR